MVQKWMQTVMVEKAVLLRRTRVEYEPKSQELLTLVWVTLKNDFAGAHLATLVNLQRAVQHSVCSPHCCTVPPPGVGMRHYRMSQSASSWHQTSSTTAQ